jgi:hypothetical protein
MSVQVTAAAWRGEYQFIYITPELAASQTHLLQQLRARTGLSLLAVDEAHCVSEVRPPPPPPALTRQVHVQPAPLLLQNQARRARVPASARPAPPPPTCTQHPHLHPTAVGP